MRESGGNVVSLSPGPGVGLGDDPMAGLEHHDAGGDDLDMVIDMQF